MKALTVNLNGVRSAARRGFFVWAAEQRPDFVLAQEIRADETILADPAHQLERYRLYAAPAERKGYSGVAIYSRHRPDAVVMGTGIDDFDREGRCIRLDFGQLSVISLYLPSGSSGSDRQDFKLRMLEVLKPWWMAMREDHGREYLVSGDLNIAHRPIDLKNWRSNQKNSGFLPEERAWLDWLFDDAGFVDAFRVLDPAPDRYTWWSNRGQARAKNVGWRIDYHVITPGLRGQLKATSIHTADHYSDHAPLMLEFKASLRALRSGVAAAVAPLTTV